jgi:hypothetical protein
MSTDTTEKKGIDLNLILQIVSIIGLILFLSKILGKSEEDKKKKEGEESRKKKYNEVEPSFQDYEYSDYADELEAYLLRDATEDEEGVYGVFQEVKNISDVNKIIEFFADRRLGGSLDYISLPRAIAKLFSPSEKQKLNLIIAKKGIEYKFK